MRLVTHPRLLPCLVALAAAAAPAHAEPGTLYLTAAPSTAPPLVEWDWLFGSDSCISLPQYAMSPTPPWRDAPETVPFQADPQPATGGVHYCPVVFAYTFPAAARVEGPLALEFSVACDLPTYLLPRDGDHGDGGVYGATMHASSSFTGFVGDPEEYGVGATTLWPWVPLPGYTCTADAPLGAAVAMEQEPADVAKGQTVYVLVSAATLPFDPGTTGLRLPVNGTGAAAALHGEGLPAHREPETWHDAEEPSLDVVAAWARLGDGIHHYNWTGPAQADLALVAESTAGEVAVTVRDGAGTELFAATLAESGARDALLTGTPGPWRIDVDASPYAGTVRVTLVPRDAAAPAPGVAPPPAQEPTDAPMATADPGASAAPVAAGEEPARATPAWALPPALLAMALAAWRRRTGAGTAR